jgi:hypothetical protein
VFAGRIGQLLLIAEPSSLQTRIAAMESVSVVHADENLTAFLEFESTIRACGDCA